MNYFGTDSVTIISIIRCTYFGSNNKLRLMYFYMFMTPPPSFIIYVCIILLSPNFIHQPKTFPPKPQLQCLRSASHHRKSNAETMYVFYKIKYEYAITWITTARKEIAIHARFSSSNIALICEDGNNLITHQANMKFIRFTWLHFIL